MSPLSPSNIPLSDAAVTPMFTEMAAALAFVPVIAIIVTVTVCIICNAKRRILANSIEEVTP